jgi:short-subunit dehydrogenase
LQVTKAFLPGLLERPEAHIANVSSMGGFLPVPGQTVYGATKAAIKLLSEGLQAELAETDVGVTVIMPGGVSTEITTNSGVESPIDPEEAENSRIPTTSPSDAATAIVDGIEHDQLYVYIGVDSKLMNLATRVAPRQASKLIRKQMKGLLDRLAAPDSPGLAARCSWSGAGIPVPRYGMPGGRYSRGVAGCRDHVTP